MITRYNVGDCVIFYMGKESKSPGPRATHVVPAAAGETYSYEVPKYWRVIEVGNNGTLVMRTRRGKLKTVELVDPRLRKAHWWEKLLYASRFPALSPSDAESKQPNIPGKLDPTSVA